MAQTSFGVSVLNQLNHGHEALLDALDKLHNLGLGEIIDLPRIIVAGGRQSGKSSVLEALSRVRFPAQSLFNPQFAMELIVRTSSREEVVVKIRPHHSTSPGLDIVVGRPPLNVNKLAELFELAKGFIRTPNDLDRLSEDIMHIEISGPKLPSLSLVDLPGIPASEMKGLIRRSKAQAILERYMKQKNSIVLAVINASDDFAEQRILTEVKLHDPDGERTIGVVTSPDKLAMSNSQEIKYLQLIRNQQFPHVLKYGWHVLRNRGPTFNDVPVEGGPGAPDDERDEKEREFLAKGVWGPLPDDVKGIESLRRKLSKVLSRDFEQRLPAIVEDIEAKLEARQKNRTRLGRPRTSISELQRYLQAIFDDFRHLTRLAIKGTYVDAEFFGDPSADDYPRGLHSQSDARRLRAVVTGLNEAFDRVISSKGARREITWGPFSADSNNTKDNKSEAVNPTLLHRYIDLYDVCDPLKVTWSELKAELESLECKGPDAGFPGLSNDELALIHFRDQSKGWQSIAKTHLNLAVKAAKAFAELALRHCTMDDKRTCDALLRQFIEPFFEQRISCLQEKLDELLFHYTHGEAITLQTSLIRSLLVRDQEQRDQLMQKILAKNRSVLFGNKFVLGEETKELLARSAVERFFPEEIQDPKDPYALETAVNKATVFYEMSLRTFTENVIILAVENCLISKLPLMLTKSMVNEMDKDALEKVVAVESPETKQQRTDLENDISMLEEGLRICKRLISQESPAQVWNSPSRAVSIGAEEKSPSKAPSRSITPEPASVVPEPPPTPSSKFSQPGGTANAPEKKKLFDSIQPSTNSGLTVPLVQSPGSGTQDMGSRPSSRG